MKVATLSFAGPTQDAIALVQGVTAKVAALGNLTITIPEPPDPAFPKLPDPPPPPPPPPRLVVPDA